MINKRLLVKKLLAHHGENSFFDKKRKLDLSHKEGKAKLLKHICALANSNPANNSYIIIGVKDDNDRILGVEFFDDSKIQNLINAYLNNPPRVSYENILFPHLHDGKVIGLITIRSVGKVASFKKMLWKYRAGTYFRREGSISMPTKATLKLEDQNSETVARIEQSAKNNIELTLNGVVDFMKNQHRDLQSDFKVFKEQFVVCWAGLPKSDNGHTYLSRVDIELINEQVKLFYSALDSVSIHFTPNTYTIMEYVKIGLGKDLDYHPLEETTLNFRENGSYQIDANVVFAPPKYDNKTLDPTYRTYTIVIKRLYSHQSLSDDDLRLLRKLPDDLLVCYLNGYDKAKQHLEKLGPYLKKVDQKSFNSLKRCLRILRKVNYN